jgi:chromosome segregation ATPase
MDPKKSEGHTSAVAYEFGRGLKSFWATGRQRCDRLQMGLGVVWPNEPEKVAHEAAEILLARHRHHRATDDAILAPIGPLTTRAWQAAQYGLHGEEAAAQALFDEIRTVVAELDRLSAPFQETIEMRLATAESERAQLGECLVDLRNRLANSEASLRIAGDQISSLTNAVENLNARISSMLASRCWQPDEAAEEENFTIEAQSYKMDLNMASNSTASPGRRGLVALAGDLICSTGSLMFSSNR